MTLDVGLCLGPYEITSPLGSGGMGEVYKARDTRLDRTVAVKVLPPHLARNPALRQRFAREAKAISALNHPHICTLHDVGHQDGIDYLVMEYLEGESLGVRLRRGPLPLAQALRHGTEIAEALDRAHRAGIVHRDLKPSNVMLTRWGAKLLDFGVAKLRADRTPSEGDEGKDYVTASEERPFTEEGRLLGTVSYMAPEQLQGGQADARTDLFAFGVVLHEMVTGRRAFPGKSLAGVVAAILESDVEPVSRVQPGAPPALDRAVAMCLAKDPEDRWQSAHDLAAHLRWIAQGGSQAAAPVLAAPVPAATVPTHEAIRPTRIGRRAWTAAAFALGAAVALVVAPRLRAPDAPAAAAAPERPAVRFQVTLPQGTLLAPGSRLALSPDGERIAFFGLLEGRPHLYVRGLNALATTRIAGTEGGQHPFWSPDGRQVGFYLPDSLRAVDVQQRGRVRTLCKVGTPGGGASWGRSGVILFESGGRLFQVAEEGGAAKALDGQSPDRPRQDPELLPDGRHYLYQSVGSGRSGGVVSVGALDSGASTPLVDDATNASYSASGHLLFVRDNTLLAQPFDAETRELSGKPFPVSREVTLAAGPALGRAYGVSSNGVVAWQAGAAPPGGMQLTWFDRAGRRLGTVGEPAEYSAPALSPDEKSLAVGRRDPQTRTRDVLVFDLVGGAGRRLTTSPADEAGPAWSPDGSWIFYNSDRNGDRQIYRRPADGSGAEEPVLANPAGSVHVEDVSPDGSRLLFNVWRGNQTDLFVLPLPRAGGRAAVPFAATGSAEEMGKYSPRGYWVAYCSDESGRDEVYVQRVSSDGLRGAGKWAVSSTGGQEPRWRGDGQELYYVAGSAVMAVDVKAPGDTFESGPPRRLFDVQLPELRRNRLVVTRDGQRFLVNTTLGHRVERIDVLVGWASAAR